MGRPFAPVQPPIREDGHGELGKRGQLQTRRELEGGPTSPPKGEAATSTF